MRVVVALVAVLGVSVTAANAREVLWGRRDQARIAVAVEELGRTASKFVLYSLEPTIPDGQSVRATRRFHDFDILGRTEITDRSEQRALLRALAGGVRENYHTVANCFNPRHGLHIEQRGRSIDLVICFECLQTYAYGFQCDSFLNSASPQPTFDAALRRHHLPLAPQRGLTNCWSQPLAAPLLHFK